MDRPNPKDAHIIEVIDNALAEYDSEVEAWKVEDHRMAMDATAYYEAWLRHDRNGD